MRRYRWSPCLVSLGLACLLVTALAPGARAVTVGVSPADTIMACEDTIVVRVASADVFPDLKAYQLMFHYDSSILRYLGAEAGDVLTGTGQPFVVEELNDVAPPPDTVWVDCAQLVGSTSCPGVLIYFKFKAIAAGDCPITCLTVDFRDSWNVQTIPDCVGGVVHVTTCPTPARAVTWGSLKTLYR